MRTEGSSRNRESRQAGLLTRPPCPGMTIMFSLSLTRPAASRATRRTRRNLTLEALEGRQLMSLGAEFGIPTTTQSVQISSDNASSSNGNSVVVWTDFSQGDSDIRAQRLNSQGARLGSELIVAGKVGTNDFDPAVAIDAQGDFVVSWTQDHASGGTDVMAQKFNPAGVPVNGTVPVGVGTFAETHSDVAMDAVGNFVVAYTRNTNDNNPDVFAKRYNTNSQLLGVITVGGSPHPCRDPADHRHVPGWPVRHRLRVRVQRDRRRHHRRSIHGDRWPDSAVLDREQ